MMGSEGAPRRERDDGALCLHNHNQTIGTASAVRQKALATGPVSERRTKIGAKAIAQPPPRRQRNAAVESGAWAAGAEAFVMAGLS